MENDVQHSTSDEPMKLTYDFIKEITNGLDKERIVGIGAFGTVYKGVYKNGEEIAVKILHNMPGFDREEFLKEYGNLSGLKHQNVVELVGFCDESKEVPAEHEGKQVVATQIHTALCFEYAKNGNLQKHICAENKGLNWCPRYKIIKGICQGLKYLREGLKDPVMHLDLKPANILLDKAMVPKIADFGLSRLFGEDNTRRTISSVGTLGYLPPEYIELQVISQAFDIFSLGVIITKIITGHEGYNSIADMAPAKFVKQVHDKWRERLVLILKPRPLEVYCHQVKRCIEIALECIKRNRQDRPTIQCIVSTLLETETMIQNLGLQADQFPNEDAESVDMGRYILEGELPGMLTHSTRSKTENSEPSGLGPYPNRLPLDLLRNVTDQFSDKRILGQDAFGTVYEGTLADGKVITVKRLAETSPVARHLVLTNEVCNSWYLEHRNIVKLVGYSHEVVNQVVKSNGRYIVADVQEFILCHEYLPKGTLQKNLFEVRSRMDWDTRFNIIKGICVGLNFLHSIPIIHMDLKPGTIFLDEKMKPKITGFGISRDIHTVQTRIFTENVVGSHAYMSPEYIKRGEISMESDIYSLGLLILEIVTCQRNISIMNNRSGVRFIDEVRKYWTLERIASVYHSSANSVAEVKTCIDVGLLCVDLDRRVRPSTEYILDVLYGFVRLSTKLHGARPISSGLDYLFQQPPNFSDTDIGEPGSDYLFEQRRPDFSYTDLDGDWPIRPDADTLIEQPPQLCFLLEPKRLTSRSLYLTNSTENRIAFRLVTETPRQYLTKLPLCGIVPPKCTYTLCVTMLEHEKAPLSNGNNFLSLQTKAVRGKEAVSVDNPDSVTQFLERAGDTVQEVKVTISYEFPARRSIFNWKQKNQSIQQAIEIIDGQNYRQVLSIDMHSTEPWILTSNQRGYACIWNYQTQAEVHCFEVSREEPVYSAKFVEREEWLVVGGGDGYIYVYRYDTMKEVTSVGAHGGRRPVTSLAIHPTHSLVLSASDDEIIKLWDWKNDWQCTRTFEWHNNRVTQVMFDPNDSNSFASTSLDGTVKIWNTSLGTCTITLDGLHCLHYITGDNGPLLVSGSSNGSAKIWDLQTDSCVNMLNGHASHLNALSWHPELAVLITGSADGTVQIWKFIDDKYWLENIIGFNLGSVNDLGYVKTLERIVVGCDQGVIMMEIKLP